MLNYANLNDIEFEYLCMDVLSQMLGIKLQRFGSGSDGGIDLTDDSYRKNIVVQVKHYIRTDNSGLLRSLRAEIKKVDELKPKKYYVCCSKELTPQVKEQIYAMFSDYMESTANIISLTEIDDFLCKEENAEILRKHFKLWLESTSILTNALANDIFLDCESLLCNIEDEQKLFVKTAAFDKAIASLNKNNVLVIVGDPGVGKTITSKMLVLHYAAQGCRVRYTTDVSDLASLKRALSASRDTKEVILLDDCFGQAYFSMKSTQETELLSLVRHIHMNPNKILILNSRVTIYREAQERTPDLMRSFNSKEYKVFVLDMSKLSKLEKAKIFYNHLYFNNLPDSFRIAIKSKGNYYKIIEHANYNPRIIEYICNEQHLKSVSMRDYMKFVLAALDNPQEAWKNEYERRLLPSDRLLITTIYSLTNTTISLDFVKKCYNHRIMSLPGIDRSINQFESSLGRLNGSFIKILDDKGKQMLSIANPSINDFIRAHLASNEPEYAELLSSCISVGQFRKLLDDASFAVKIASAFADKSILTYYFEDDFQKAAYITEYVSMKCILDEDYSLFVNTYVRRFETVNVFDKHSVWASMMIERVLEKDFCLFYKIDKLVKDFKSMETILERFELPDLVTYIESVDWIMVGEIRSDFVLSMTKLLKEAISFFFDTASIDSYDIKVGDIVEDRKYLDEDGGHIDVDGVIEDIEDIVKGSVRDEVDDLLFRLPKDIVIDKDFLMDSTISVCGVDNLVKNYLQDDYDDEYRYDRHFENEEIDYIFNR